MSLQEHSIVKICTLKVSFFSLTLQVSMDSCATILFILGISLKVQTRPTEDFPCICTSQPFTFTFFFTSTCRYYYHHLASFLNYYSHSFSDFPKPFKTVGMSLNIL